MTNEPMPQEQLDAIRGREAKATAGPWGVDGPAQCGPGDTLTVYPVEDGGTVAYVQPCWDDAEFIAHAREDIPALLTDNEQLRALTTVTDDMVERAARESYGPKMWDRLLLGWDTLAPVKLSAHRAMTRAVLDAALNPGSCTQQIGRVTTCPYCGNEAGPYTGYVEGAWVCNSEQRDDCYTISSRDEPFKDWARNATPSDTQWGTWRDREGS